MSGQAVLTLYAQEPEEVRQLGRFPVMAERLIASGALAVKIDPIAEPLRSTDHPAHVALSPSTILGPGRPRPIDTSASAISRRASKTSTPSTPECPGPMIPVPVLRTASTSTPKGPKTSEKITRKVSRRVPQAANFERAIAWTKVDRLPPRFSLTYVSMAIPILVIKTDYRPSCD